MARTQTAPRGGMTEQRCRPLAAETARRRLLADMPVTERRLLLAGISTAVLEGAAGPPVILLHGPLGNAGHWMGVIPGLASTHHVIVPDLPGHGSSEVTSSTLDASRVLDWLDQLIAETCESPPVLIGQTLGGAIAARFAGGQGKLPSQLVLIDTLGLRDFQPAPEFGLALTQFLAQPSED